MPHSGKGLTLGQACNLLETAVALDYPGRKLVELSRKCWVLPLQVRLNVNQINDYLFSITDGYVDEYNELRDCDDMSKSIWRDNLVCELMCITKYNEQMSSDVRRRVLHGSGTWADLVKHSDAASNNNYGYRNGYFSEYDREVAVMAQSNKRVITEGDTNCDIVREEMPRRPKFKSKEEAYNERFATTKGGSHSAIGSKIAREYVDNLPAGQINRRNFVEALHSNPLCKLPPAAWVSRSKKLEHGKSRALFACDTINYMHFDAPCTAIERVWLGRRCILRPGGESDSFDISKRAAVLRKYKIMLDYADFNSAHTLEAQKNGCTRTILWA